MPNRMISLERNTNETQIDLTLDLDGTGRYEVDTGCGFLNHMLELFCLLYTSPSPRDGLLSRMPSSA